jgi:hypothetical protein
MLVTHSQFFPTSSKYNLQYKPSFQSKSAGISWSNYASKWLMLYAIYRHLLVTKSHFLSSKTEASTISMFSMQYSVFITSNGQSINQSIVFVGEFPITEYNWKYGKINSINFAYYKFLKILECVDSYV